MSIFYLWLFTLTFASLLLKETQNYSPILLDKQGSLSTILRDSLLDPESKNTVSKKQLFAKSFLSRTFENPPDEYTVTHYKKIEDCKEVKTVGLYQIKIPRFKHHVQIRCEVKFKGGGWIVIQNRKYGVVDFYRPWTDYKNGFGDLQTDFWYGLEKISLITNNGKYELMIVLEDAKGHKGFAKYDHFVVAPESDQYKLEKLGVFEGDIGDAFLYHLGASFTTYDRKNDKHDDANCATSYRGGWWYRRCYQCNLNGRFPNEFEVGSQCEDCMVWNSFYIEERLKSSLMLIRLNNEDWEKRKTKKKTK